jgi:hypothetical protein
MNHFLSSALDGGDDRVNVMLGPFISDERTTGIRWKGGWVEPRAALVTVARSKACREPNQGGPTRNVTLLTEVKVKLSRYTP